MKVRFREWPLQYRLLPSLCAVILVSTNAPLAGRGFFDDLGREAGSCLSGGCDVIWSVNQRIDAGISSKTQSAVDPIQKAVNQILRELFKNDIDPMLDHLNKISEERLDQIDKIVQAAITKARAATSDTIDDVKDKIIIESANQIKGVSAAILDDVTCAEIRTGNQAQVFIDNNFRIFDSIRNAMNGLVDKCAVGVDRNNYWTVYSGLKCAYEVKIGNAATVKEIQYNYHSFLEETSKAKCVLRDASNISEALNDQREYTKRLNTWNLATK